MGRGNRQRRAEKQRRRARAAGQRSHHADRRLTGGDTEELLAAAASALRTGDDVALEALLTLLDGDGPGWRRLVSRALAGFLDRAVATAWSVGWQPADLVRVGERQLGYCVAGLVVDAIASEARSYLGLGSAVDPAWADQLGAAGAQVWWDEQLPHLEQWAGREGLSWRAALRAGVEVLSFLANVPALPRLGPPPQEWGVRGRPGPRRQAGDAKVLGRVRALLAKAESTQFPEEAEALSAKAQELMARHAIDVAMIEASHGAGEEPAGRRLGVDPPYAAGKAHLLSQIAQVNRCRAVWSKALGFSTVFGYPLDLDAVEVLYTSLLVQATSAMVSAGRQRDARGRSRTRSFRSSFMVAYAVRIGERLRAAAASGVAAAAEVHGSSLLPVLTGREDAVAGACDAAFPEMTRHALAITNPTGWVAGRAAAEVASLSVHEQVASGAIA